MGCCPTREHIKIKCKNPVFSEPKWFVHTGSDVTLTFKAARFIWLTQLIVPIIDGAAAGTAMTFRINGQITYSWSTGVGLQSDVKPFFMDYLVDGTSVTLNMNDTATLTYTIQLFVVTDEANC